MRRVTDDDDRRQTTNATGTSEQNNTGPLGGPVITNEHENRWLS